MQNLICRMEFDEKGGLIATIENHEENLTQTIHLTKDSIVTTCQGSETSVIVQKQDSIAMKCKKFTAQTDTVNTSSKQASKFISNQKYEMESIGNTNVNSTKMVNIKGSKTNINQ